MRHVGKTPVASENALVLPQFWILCLDPCLSTIDDFAYSTGGFVWCAARTASSVRKGDISVLFDTGAKRFRGIARFLGAVRVVQVDDRALRHEFELTVIHKAREATKLSELIGTLRPTEHPAAARGWPRVAFTPLTAGQFDQLIEAWWGVKNHSHQFAREAKA